MHKKAALIVLMIIGLLLMGCDVGFGSKYADDPREYGDWEAYLDIPSFLPNSIVGYQANGYSYTLLAYMDICFEIFLDISVSEEQFGQLLADARSHGEYTEKEAYYCDGYFEIVFQDDYEIYRGKDDLTENVGWADIEKVVYNSETLTIIYVCFHANDTGVYPLTDVAYFNRFSINQENYVANLE